MAIRYKTHTGRKESGKTVNRINFISEDYSTLPHQRVFKMSGYESIWILLWFLPILQLPSVMVYGCSCLRYPVSLCDDYESSSSVYAARVINATCNCVPDGGTNGGYSFYAYTNNVSCVSAALTDSGEVVSETVVRTTCNVYRSFPGLPCKNILADFAGASYNHI